MAFAIEGRIIAQRYRLQHPLGRGAMGVVWRAIHLTLNAPVAVKLVDPELLDPSSEDRDEVLARFNREAQAAAAMRSPHVVQILDHGVEEGVPFMVMELLEGETLEDRLDRLGKLPPAMTAHIMTHVARALGKAHEVGIVHRDLKPSNVFLVHDDEEEVAKVLDFGIAKFNGPLDQSGALATKTGHLLGTPAFMSPEQASGVDVVDHRTDLWAMAVMTFECVTGELPFNSEAVGDLILQICARPMPVPSKVAPVPPDFDEWFAKAANRDPAKRTQTAREFSDSLRTVLVGRPSLPISVASPISSNDFPRRVVSAREMTHRGVVSQLHTTSTSSSRPFWRYVAVSSFVTLSLMGIGAILYLSGDPGEGTQTGVQSVIEVDDVAPPVDVTAPPSTSARANKPAPTSSSPETVPSAAPTTEVDTEDQPSPASAPFPRSPPKKKPKDPRLGF